MKKIRFTCCSLSGKFAKCEFQHAHANNDVAICDAKASRNGTGSLEFPDECPYRFVLDVSIEKPNA